MDIVPNALRFGQDEVYGSIDELLGRYIAPMNDFVEELVNHRKFIDLTEDEVDEKLMEMKKITPKAIPYALCWMDSHPGHVSLRFVGSVTPRNHPVSVTPKGYQWGTQTFQSLDRLINEFKRNPRGTAKPREETKVGAKTVTKNRWGAPKPTTTPPAASPAAPPAWSRPPPPPVPPPAPAPLVHAYPPIPPGYPPPPMYYPGYPPHPGYPPPHYAYPPPPPQHPHHRPQPPSYAPPPHAAPPGAYPYGQPVPYDAAQSAAAAAGAEGSQGRGRGRTLPAWMSKDG